MNQDWTPEERKLSAALHQAADAVTPGADGLAQIRRRTAARVPWWRSPAVLGVAGGIATAALVIVLAVSFLGTGGDPDTAVQPADSPAVTETDSPPEPTTPPEEATEEPDITPDPTGEADETAPPGDDAEAGATTLPVYYVVDERITREWQSAPAADDPLVAAVHRSLNEPAHDPRYRSLWSPVEVISVDVVGDVIEVNLASPVELDADADLAGQAVQQLVYTVTAAASSTRDDVEGALPVQILVDGTPPDDLFGELDLSDPVTRADQTDVRYFIQVDTPTYGEELTTPVEIHGVAAAFEANVLWELRRDGDVVDSGFTTTGEAFTFSEYSITFDDLEPGTYEITVMEDDPSGGEGRDPFYETKVFTVVEP